MNKATILNRFVVLDMFSCTYKGSKTWFSQEFAQFRSLWTGGIHLSYRLDTFWNVSEQWSFFKNDLKSLFLRKIMIFCKFLSVQYRYNTTFFWTILGKHKKVQNCQNEVENRWQNVDNCPLFIGFLLDFVQISGGRLHFLFCMKKNMSSL